MNNEYEKLTEEFLAKMTFVRAPLEAYVAGLKHAMDELRTVLDAAEQDVIRANKESE